MRGGISTDQCGDRLRRGHPLTNSVAHQSCSLAFTVCDHAVTIDAGTSAQCDRPWQMLVLGDDDRAVDAEQVPGSFARGSGRQPFAVGAHNRRIDTMVRKIFCHRSDFVAGGARCIAGHQNLAYLSGRQQFDRDIESSTQIGHRRTIGPDFRAGHDHHRHRRRGRGPGPISGRYQPQSDIGTRAERSRTGDQTDTHPKHYHAELLRSVMSCTRPTIPTRRDSPIPNEVDGPGHDSSNSGQPV